METVRSLFIPVVEPVIENQTAVIDDCDNAGDLDITFQAEITDEGASIVTKRGFLYIQDPGDLTGLTIDVPEAATKFEEEDVGGFALGVFTRSVTLATGTWHYRSFARNADGDTYGTIMSVGPCAVPTVTTSTDILAVFCNGAQVQTTVSNNGSLALTSKGVLLLAGDPDDLTAAEITGDPVDLIGATRVNSTVSGTTAGTYTVSLSGLSVGTTYHYKSFAENSEGFGYGGVESFITPEFCASYGSYVGDGTTNRPLIGLGYTPDFIYIRSEESEISALIATSTMSPYTEDTTTFSKRILSSSNAVTENHIRIINNGIRVGLNSTPAELALSNKNGITYHFWALENGVDALVGRYTGDAAGSRGINVGFEPAAVMVIPEASADNGQVVLKMATRTNAVSITQNSDASSTAYFQDPNLTATGFNVGINFNTNTSVYHYLAVKSNAEVRQQSYTSTCNTSYALAAPTFSPQVMLVSQDGNRPVYIKTPSMDNNGSFNMRGSEA